MNYLLPNVFHSYYLFLFHLIAQITYFFFMLFYPLCWLLSHSLSVVEVIVLQTGQRMCGFRKEKMTGWFQIAAAKPQAITVAVGTTLLISTR